MTPNYEELIIWFTPKRTANFWRSIRKTAECWLWKKATFEGGYGKYRVLHGSCRAHRIAWMLAIKQDIPPGSVVRHGYCRNPTCCNPEHLTIGTQQQNRLDSVFHAVCDSAANIAAESVYDWMYGRFVTVV